MITHFNIFENKCSFIYNGIDDLKYFIESGLDINCVFLDKTYLQEIITYYNNSYTGIIDGEESHNLEDVESVKLLLTNGFTNINYISKYFGTALHMASNNGYFMENVFDIDDWIIKILIDAGADCFIKYKGKYFFDVLEVEELEIIKKLYPEIYQKHMKLKKSDKFNL